MILPIVQLTKIAISGIIKKIKSAGKTTNPIIANTKPTISLIGNNAIFSTNPKALKKNHIIKYINAKIKITANIPLPPIKKLYNLSL